MGAQAYRGEMSSLERGTRNPYSSADENKNLRTKQQAGTCQPGHWVMGPCCAALTGMVDAMVSSSVPADRCQKGSLSAASSEPATHGPQSARCARPTTALEAHGQRGPRPARASATASEAAAA